MRNCNVCQKFNNIIHVQATTLHSVSSSWPFYKWGIDIMGLLPLATIHRKFILVATIISPCGKKPRQIKVTQLIQFVQKSIVCRFGVPYSIVLDNGPQFISKPFQQFYTEYGIKKCLLYTSISPIQQPSRSHKQDITRLSKKQLTKVKGKLVDELPIALWAYRTTPK